VIGNFHLIRIDDPGTDLVRNGDNMKGWEGDTRLAVYWNPEFQTWELWRLEANNEYSLCEAWNARLVKGAEVTGKMIDWLLTHDTARGFNVLQYVEDENAKLDAIVEKERVAMFDEIAEKLPWAVEKDGLV
jgi:hypothetical protein